MKLNQIILLVAAAMAAIAAGAILAWLLRAAWLRGMQRRLAARKGPYRELVAGLADRERALLEPAIHQLRTYRDFEALEAVLEEQARGSAERPAWLLDAYDRLGLVDKYVERLRTSARWRDRAFAAELLGRVGNANAVPALLDTVRATRSEDGDVREIALRALARIGDPRAVPSLVDALRSAEPWLAPRLADVLTRHGADSVTPMMQLLENGTRHHARPWAANVLGELRAQRAFPVLVRALGDIEDEVRARAAYALGRLGDRRAIPYLLEHLLTDPAPFVRARIAGALGQFDDPDVIERLVRALADPAWWVRMRSVEALEQIGPQAEGPLLVALDDPDPELRMRSAVALERLGVPARTVAMIEQDDRPEEAHRMLAKLATAGACEMLAELLIHPSAKIRRAVIGAIRRTARRDLGPELAAVARNDEDPALRAAAFDTLRAQGDRTAIPVAIAGMQDPNESVRAEATRLLGDLGGADIADAVRLAIDDEQPAVRAAAARALGLLRAEAAEPELAQLLTDPAPAVRAAAADAAAESGITSLAAALVPLLSDSADTVRVAAARALGWLGDSRAAVALTRAFAGASVELREAVAVSVAQLDPARLGGLLESLQRNGSDPAAKLALVRTLAQAPQETARGLLGKLFIDPEPPVRAAAVGAIGRLGGEGAVALVSEGLADPDEAVRAAAINAIIRLGDRTHGIQLLDLLAHDSAPAVRERAALAAGLLPIDGAEAPLAHACATTQPPNVRAAAVLALGAFGHESIAGRVAEMTDDEEVRGVLHDRLRSDPEFRLLGRKLRQSHSLELRALATLSRTEMEQELAEGIRNVLDPRERMRAVAALCAFQGERSREALLQVVRGDPSPAVRASALLSVADMLDAGALSSTARRALGDPSLAVRRTAAGLFANVPPDEALPVLLGTLRADEDATVLEIAASHAGAAFDRFAHLLRAGRASGREAVVAARIARHIEHPQVRDLLPLFAGSADPAVRAAFAEVLAERPELADEPTVRALASDPVVEVRHQAARAAAAANLHVPLTAMADDPDPELRRRLALLLQTVPDGGTLTRLRQDPDDRVRGAATVSAILRGELHGLPDDVRRAAAAEAVVDAGDLADLRTVARTSPDERHRLAAALALALLDDQVAHEVSEADPVPALRQRVRAVLELPR